MRSHDESVGGIDARPGGRNGSFTATNHGLATLKSRSRERATGKFDGQGFLSGNSLALLETKDSSDFGVHV